MAGVTFNLTLQSLFLFILAIPSLHLYFLYVYYVNMYAKHTNVKSIVFYFLQATHFYFDKLHICLKYFRKKQKITSQFSGLWKEDWLKNTDTTQIQYYRVLHYYTSLLAVSSCIFTSYFRQSCKRSSTTLLPDRHSAAVFYLV